MPDSNPYSPPATLVRPPPSGFSWWSTLVGGAVAMGASAFLGTVVTNVSLWLFMQQGLSLQAAYARMGTSITSPVELLSLAVLTLSGVFGGYVSAAHGGGRDLAQGTAAGVVGSAFFGAMALGPASQSVPGWYLPVSVGGAVFSGLVGGLLHARRA